MIPVDMIVTHNPPEAWGDCTRACVASIFELPPEEVPHFADGAVDSCGNHPWAERLTEWLAPRGFVPLWFRIESEAQEWAPEICQFYYIRGGKTRRGTEHDTVWFGGKMVHDPQWRDRSGLLPEYPHEMLVFVKK